MRHVLMGLVLLVAGCESILGPDFDLRFLHQRPMEHVPGYFPDRYAAIEECLGQTGDFAAARWFVADSIWIDGDPKLGVTHGDEITVRQDRIRSRTVPHEMVHHITGWGNEAHRPDGTLFCEDAVHVVP